MMIELLLILTLFAIGVLFVYIAADTIMNDILAAIVGLAGGVAMMYALFWFFRWLILGGLVL